MTFSDVGAALEFFASMKGGSPMKNLTEVCIDAFKTYGGGDIERRPGVHAQFRREVVREKSVVCFDCGVPLCEDERHYTLRRLGATKYFCPACGEAVKDAMGRFKDKEDRKAMRGSDPANNIIAMADMERLILAQPKWKQVVLVKYGMCGSVSGTVQDLRGRDLPPKVRAFKRSVVFERVCRVLAEFEQVLREADYIEGPGLYGSAEPSYCLGA